MATPAGLHSAAFFDTETAEHSTAVQTVQQGSWFLDLLQQVPALLQAMPADTKKALLRTSKDVRNVVHEHVTRLTVWKEDLSFLSTRQWSHLQSLSLTKVHRDSRAYNEHLTKAAANCLINMELPLLRELHFSSWNWGVDDQLMAVLNTGSWSRLETLDLGQNFLQSAGCEQLIQGRWPTLKTLILSDCFLGTEACAHLATGVWPQLRYLDLSKNRLEDEAMLQLVNGRWPLLDKLDLTSNMLSTAAVKCLVSSAWPLLTGIVLNSNELSEEALLLFTHTNWPALEYIGLRHNNLSAAENLSLDAWPLLKGLDVGRNIVIGCMLCASLQSHLPTLERLDLSGQQHSLNANDVASLIEAELPCLTRLNLSESLCFEDMYDAIGHLVLGYWPLLQSLDLSRHEQYDTDTEASFSSSADSLELDSEDESDDKWEAFDASIIGLFARADWPKLKHLNLSLAGITDTALEPMRGAKWPCLESLDLSNNPMSVAAFDHLCRCSWPDLRYLAVGNITSIVMTSAEALQRFHRRC